MKRIIAILLSLITAACVLLYAGTVRSAGSLISTNEAIEGTSLTAREDGSFRVLLVADTQDTDKPQEMMLKLLEAELDNADADLVIFLGDMIYGPSIGADREKVETAIRAVIEPVVERNLPFAVAFGNHDDQGSLSKEEQLAIYQSYPGCLNEDPDIPGVGNTCLKICPQDSADASILLWIMDSGTYAEKEIGGYGYVTQEQNEWFLDGMSASGNTVSYVFQHIPVPQVFQLVEKAAPFSKGAFHTFGNPTTAWYTEKSELIQEGHFGETPCPPKFDSGQFQTWKDTNVKAAFFGHDHTNDYRANIEGIDMIATTGIGFYSYGRGEEHGARLLVLHTDRPEEFETQMVFYKDLFDEPIPLRCAPVLGIQFRRILIFIFSGLAAFIIVLIIVIRALVKRHRRKKGTEAKKRGKKQKKS